MNNFEQLAAAAKTKLEQLQSTSDAASPPVNHLEETIAWSLARGWKKARAKADQASQSDLAADRRNAGEAATSPVSMQSHLESVRIEDLAVVAACLQDLSLIHI